MNIKKWREKKRNFLENEHAREPNSGTEVEARQRRNLGACTLLGRVRYGVSRPSF